MSLAATVVTLVVAFLHFGFMVLETFLWARPTGRKVFQLTEEDAETTRVLAANQGVYNGALAACLVWATVAGPVEARVALLAFVVVAGVYGGATVKPTIYVIQALPALVALGLTLAA